MLTTPRLHVRQLRPDDYDRMLEVYSNPEGARWVGDGEPISAEDCARWVEVTLKNYETRGYGMSVVELLAGGEVVGFVGLVHPGGQEVPELKYAYAKEHWGKGFATEVAIAMIQHGASALGMTRIIATTDPGHVASHRVLQKAGMVEVGTHVDEDGDSILTFEWQSS